MANATKSEAQVSADLPDETDAIDDLAHALADYSRRKVVVVGTDDQEEVVVEPRAKQRLDSCKPPPCSVMASATAVGVVGQTMPSFDPVGLVARS